MPPSASSRASAEKPPKSSLPRAEAYDRLTVARHSMAGREFPGRDSRVVDPHCNEVPTRRGFAADAARLAGS
jgi:hypothetical protein